jgi:hypothetical protein
MDLLVQGGRVVKFDAFLIRIDSLVRDAGLLIGDAD